MDVELGVNFPYSKTNLLWCCWIVSELFFVFVWKLRQDTGEEICLYYNIGGGCKMLHAHLVIHLTVAALRRAWPVEHKVGRHHGFNDRLTLWQPFFCPHSSKQKCCWLVPYQVFQLVHPLWFPVEPFFFLECSFYSKTQRAFSHRDGFLFNINVQYSQSLISESELAFWI